MGEEVTIGPFALVAAGAVIGAGTRVGARARIGPGVEVGEACLVDTGATLGWGDAVSGDRVPAVIVGRNVKVREYAVIQAGRDEPTRVGSGCYVMSRTFVGAGAWLGDGVVVTHGSVVEPGVRVGPHAVVGGFGLLSAGAEIGRRAMIGGLSVVAGAVPPFTLAHGAPASLRGLNLVGLRRAAVPPGTRQALSRAYRLLLRGDFPPEQAEALIGKEMRAMPEVEELAAFIRRHPEARRNVMRASPEETDGEETSR